MSLGHRVKQLEQQIAADVDTKLDALLSAFVARSEAVLSEDERTTLSGYFGQLAHDGDYEPTDAEAAVLDLVDADAELTSLLNQAATVIRSTGQNPTKLDKWRKK